jgi:tetratricopeptide (TPR) repeat protein
MAEETYEQLVARGVELAEDEDFAEAIQALRQAIGLNGDLPDAHYNLAVVYGLLAMGDFDVEAYFEDRVDEEMLFQNAIDAYQRVLEIDPNHVAAHNNLGTIYALHGERDLALHELERSLELNADQPEVREQLEELRST